MCCFLFHRYVLNTVRNCLVLESIFSVYIAKYNIYLAFKQQKLIWSLFLDPSGLRPSAITGAKGVSLAITWQDCNHTLKLVQKTWVSEQLQVPVSLFLFRRKCISRYLRVQFFFRKFLVDILLWRNLNLKVISFVLFVHWKAIW